MKVVFSTFRLLFFLGPCRIPGAKPLWPVSSGRPSKANIPKCSYCAGPLCFEFQNDVDSLDWATIAVYTCEASCDTMQVWLTKKNSLGFNFLSHLVPCQILCTPRLGDIAVQVLLLNQELRKSER
ncbi:unnamed protein product [Prunus armeniaca]|uniref:Programmed cell death protein 2 C-terminal domain-containing protein n=1 Tax=Prunus armeniaca TaxID=36596 RepID=A0A6J5WZY5_PRUAR|nr:unnamed protein product [Prunus armeniaca]